jgi:hypothetical protein
MSGCVDVGWDGFGSWAERVRRIGAPIKDAMEVATINPSRVQSVQEDDEEVVQPRSTRMVMI